MMSRLDALPARPARRAERRQKCCARLSLPTGSSHPRIQPPGAACPEELAVCIRLLSVYRRHTVLWARFDPDGSGRRSGPIPLKGVTVMLPAGVLHRGQIRAPGTGWILRCTAMGAV